MTGIGFNNIPGSGLTAPIQTVEFNSGGYNGGASRVVLFGCITAAGSQAMNVPVIVNSQQAADGYAGPGSMLREMYRVAAANGPALPIWIVPVSDAGGTAAVWTITIGSLPGVAGTGIFEIEGRSISIGVNASDTPTIVAANIAAAINAYYDVLTGAMLTVTATSAVAVVTLTHRHKIALANDLDIFTDSTNPNNILGLASVWTVAQTTPGAGVPALSSALAALGSIRSEVVSPWADSVSTGAYAAWSNDISGAWAWNALYYGHVWTTFAGTFSATTTLGASLNDRHLTIKRRIAGGAGTFGQGTPTSAWNWIAGHAASALTWLLDVSTGNVSRNQSGRQVMHVRGPRNAASLDVYTSRNTLLNSGISTFTVDISGAVLNDKDVTTYQRNTSGSSDITFRDVQRMYQLSGGWSYIRAAVFAEQTQKGLSDANPRGLLAITTLADIKASYIHAYGTMCANGVFQQASAFAQSLVLQQNAGNPDRVDVGLNLIGVNPLDILATNAMVYSIAPASASTATVSP